MQNDSGMLLGTTFITSPPTPEIPSNIASLHRNWSNEMKRDRAGYEIHTRIMRKYRSALIRYQDILRDRIRTLVDASEEKPETHLELSRLEMRALEQLVAEKQAALAKLLDGPQQLDDIGYARYVHNKDILEKELATLHAWSEALQAQIDQFSALQPVQSSAPESASTSPSPPKPAEQPKPIPPSPPEPDPAPPVEPEPKPPAGPDPVPPVEPPPPNTTASTARSFRLPGGSLATFPALAASTGVLTTLQSTGEALQSALRNALTALGETAVTAGARALPALALFAYSPKLGREVEFSPDYALSTRLSELHSITSQELAGIADRGESLRLPYRLANTPSAGGGSLIQAVKTDMSSRTAQVRVLAASYDASNGVYSVQFPGAKGAHLTWTPIASNLNPSTSLPEAPQIGGTYEGAELTPVEGQVNTFPAEDTLTYTDFIAVFPIDSGLDPVYVMLQNPRNLPGVASGAGGAVTGQWLGATVDRSGAVIPDRIAEQMRGVEFKTWRDFRETFWKLVANDPALAGQFTSTNLHRMKTQGRAPSAPAKEQVGALAGFELHHIIPIQNGGSVYDMDNLRIVAPLEHNQIHYPKRHEDE